MANSIKNESIQGQEKFKEALHLAGEAASEMIEGVKGQARQKLDHNIDRVSDMANSAKERTDELTSKAEKLIKERPLLCVGCAFFAGWVISKILK